MLPSLLARDIKAALQQFLTAGFEPADAFMHGLMRRFVEDESAWLKGPYVQLGLPFVTGAAGRGFFAAFETEFPAYQHQERAWQRLSTQHQAVSTLVATGTGSGKTECFLYPVLDHCARARAAGEAGIKALVIYPMNALATDQARRIAGLIHRMPAFAKLRVGLYVGGNAGKPGEGVVMTEAGVITDRDTLRKNPPDILLTNYKMLDYLMLRPKDRQLWAHNTPTSLRYVVVDELHTFDGAQGTDLALLLRRLRARLQVPEGHLVCVGTSATLGGNADTAPLREYARQVFGVGFDAEAVITENRLSVDAFLGEATVDYMLVWRPDLATLLDPGGHASAAAAVQAWFPAFFPIVDAPADEAEVMSPAWRTDLGQHLRRHQLFVNLLRLLKGGVVSYAMLEEAFARNVPATARGQVPRVLDALLVLVAWALGEGGQPLVTLRVQIWARELRRMVARLAVEPGEVRLRSERDLPTQRDGIYLPVIQCSQCRTTGWVSRQVPGSNRLSTDLDEIYNTWFGNRPESARFYAAASIRRAHVEGVEQHACVACGSLQSSPGSCQSCSQQALLPVFLVTALRTRTTDNAQFSYHDDTCPACGESRSLVLLGARNATLGSQVVEASWASPYNDDKKLIAFSDSVQDAAHRAGFFGARTWGNNVRTAWAQVLDGLPAPRLPWPDLLAAAERSFDAPGSVFDLGCEGFVAEFIAPNMTWQRDWAVELLEHGRLPAESRLPARVRKRLLWQLYSDLTYQCQRGRTLERVGKATVSVPWPRVLAAAEALLPVLEEQLGLRGLDVQGVAQWLWGFLVHLRRRGAVPWPEMGNYLNDANVWQLGKAGGRNEWMPPMGEYLPRPIFLTLGRHRGFDRVSEGRRVTWYERWCRATLGSRALMGDAVEGPIYQAAFAVLEEQRLLQRSSDPAQGDVLALEPEALVVDREVVFLASGASERRLAVPAEDAEALLGMPCLDDLEATYQKTVGSAASWWADRFSGGDLRRVIAAEHTGLLERQEREALEARFKSREPKPWYENLLSATPTLEMGVDIGDLSSVMLCSVPPNQASFLQRVGRAGRRDGNAMATVLANGNSPHDLYFFAETEEMIAGEVAPPGVFLQAGEVLRRQLFAFCMDDWVASLDAATALPDQTSPALDAVERVSEERFPYTFCNHVLTHEQALFRRFMDLLASDADEGVRSRLLDFIQGQGETDGLRTRLMKTLQELVEERRGYKKRKDQLDTQRKQLRQQPQDEATEKQLDELQRERDALLDLIKEINGRDLLNTLTDAGLIPNYAFPEAGIQLKSVLWRRRGSDDAGDGAYVMLATQKYERPANSALSEFAPENRFYANQRRVEIDQISMSLAKPEPWRLCASCQHMQNLLIEPDVHTVCPSCGDAMWNDGGQKHTLLRFRQAIANNNDADVRIDDSTEDREPRYYLRQLMADFLPDQVREAWRVPAGEVPFGFEFIARVTFRDVNFGEFAKPGNQFKVAARDAQRPGFRICQHCGKVQKPSRKANGNSEQQHSFDCPVRDNPVPANLIECLYLYREFESEALRILVPYTQRGVDDTVVQSFMAAVQLGLKRRFGGKVDHLRMVLQDEPGKDGGPRRQYVMLYDSVPGGTGYLHQLLAQDASTLADVLQLALETIQGCICNSDPEKDGCYRCLYQYRLGRNMQWVSRESARSVLGELVGSLARLERVATISEIYINPSFDSVLESRFIESLKLIGGKGGLPTVGLTQDVVKGKSGYVLEVGGQRYRIEPQCNVGPEHGVALASCPDFMLWPWASTSPRRPVAVFCDGWTHHKDSTREDARKRTALVDSGSFWVWSVTHQDVAAAIEGKLDSDLAACPEGLARHEGHQAPPSLPRAQDGAFQEHAIARLLRWLALREGGPGSPDAAVQAWQRDAVWLTFRMVPNTPADRDASSAERSAWLQRLPGHLQQPAGAHAPLISRSSGCVRAVGSWPMALAKGPPPQDGEWGVPGALILDPAAATGAEALHASWRTWLAAYNTLQFLPAFLLATADGLDAGDLGIFGLGGPAASAVSPEAPGLLLAEAWSEVLEQVIEPIRPGLRALALAGAPLPIVGLELADTRGHVLADCELAWEAVRLAVLRDDQQDLAEIWKAEGWIALVLDPNQQVDGQPWTQAAAELLALSLESTAGEVA